MVTPMAATHGHPATRPSLPLSPRILIAAVIALALVGTGVGLGLAFSGGDSSPSPVPVRGTLVDALPGAAEIQSLFHGIPQAGNLLGRTSALVKIVEYVDLQCPYCRQFDTEVLPNLISRYVRTGEASLELRLLAFIGPDSERGRAAAIAAGKQGKMFNFVSLLYGNQGTENTGWLDERMIGAAAASIPGANVPKLLGDRGDVSAAETAVAAQAKEQQVNSTPTLFVNGERVTLAGPTDEAGMVRAITAALP